MFEFDPSLLILSKRSMEQVQPQFQKIDALTEYNQQNTSRKKKKYQCTRDQELVLS